MSIERLKQLEASWDFNRIMLEVHLYIAFASIGWLVHGVTGLATGLAGTSLSRVIFYIGLLWMQQKRNNFYAGIEP